MYGLNKFISWTARGLCSWTLDLLARDHTFVLHARKHARVDSCSHGRDRNSDFERFLRRPLAGTLLLGFIEYQINQGLASLVISFSENIRGYFDQKRLERALIPLFEDFSKFRRLETQAFAQYVI